MRAGSFQCIWFVCLGEKHQKPIVQWWHSQAAAAAAASAASAAAAAAAAAAGDYNHDDPSFSCVIATNPAELPSLTAVSPM